MRNMISKRTTINDNKMIIISSSPNRSSAGTGVAFYAIGKIFKFFYFTQSPRRRQLFKNANPAIPLPPEPIITRWGTWLEACEYYADHFESVKSVIDLLDENDAESIRESKKNLSLPNIQNQLANFMCIVSGIKVLETKGLELKEYLSVVENVRMMVNSLDKPEYKEKLERILLRNTGFESLMQIKNILYGNPHNENVGTEYVKALPPSLIAIFKFSVVTSVDVERSFSTYKSVSQPRKDGHSHLKILRDI